MVSDEGNPIVQLLELAKEEPVPEQGILYKIMCINKKENKQVSILEANLEDSEEEDQEFEPSDEEKDGL